MPTQSVQPRGTLFSFDGPALSRAHFIKKLCAENNDNRAAPVSNGIPKKCADVRFWIKQQPPHRDG